jgi:hypothetical protein
VRIVACYSRNARIKHLEKPTRMRDKYIEERKEQMSGSAVLRKLQALGF